MVLGPAVAGVGWRSTWDRRRRCGDPNFIERQHPDSRAVATISPPRTARGMVSRTAVARGRATPRGIQPPPAARSCAEDRSRPTRLTGSLAREMRTGAWTPCGQHPQAAPSAPGRRRDPLGRGRATPNAARRRMYVHRSRVDAWTGVSRTARPGRDADCWASMPNGAQLSFQPGSGECRSGSDAGAVAIRAFLILAARVPLPRTPPRLRDWITGVRDWCLGQLRNDPTQSVGGGRTGGKPPRLAGVLNERGCPAGTTRRGSSGHPTSVRGALASAVHQVLVSQETASAT
jgi:hypothetical protein